MIGPFVLNIMSMPQDIEDSAEGGRGLKLSVVSNDSENIEEK